MLGRDPELEYLYDDVAQLFKIVKEQSKQIDNLTETIEKLTNTPIIVD